MAKNKKTIIVILLIVVAIAMLNQNKTELKTVGGETVSVSNGKLKVVVPLSNTGTTAITYLLEAEVYDENKKQSSSSESTCDAGCPFNVHKVVTLAAQSSEQVTINIPESGTMPNGKYHVKLVSVDSCCNSNFGTCSAKGPYGWGVWITTTPVTVGNGIQTLDSLCTTEWCGDGDCNAYEDSGDCPVDCGNPDNTGSCTDTDSGVNPLTSGKVTIGGTSTFWQDVCTSFSGLNEWSCKTSTGPSTSTPIDCNDFYYNSEHKTGMKCQNGACVACTPSCNCASTVCAGQTCDNGCSGTCPGTKTCTQTCAQLGGVSCASTQTCNTGSFTSSSDSTRCCVGSCTNPTSYWCLVNNQCTSSLTSGAGCYTTQTECQTHITNCVASNACAASTCNDKTCVDCAGNSYTGTKVCNDDTDCGCDFYQSCNKAKTGCKTASWVYIVGGLFGLMIVVSMMPKK